MAPQRLARGCSPRLGVTGTGPARGSTSMRNGTSTPLRPRSHDCGGMHTCWRDEAHLKLGKGLNELRWRV